MLGDLEIQYENGFADVIRLDGRDLKHVKSLVVTVPEPGKPGQVMIVQLLSKVTLDLKGAEVEVVTVCPECEKRASEEAEEAKPFFLE